VLGANAQDEPNVWINTKPSIGGSWSGFSVVYNSSAVTSSQGPVIRARGEGWNNFDILVAP